MHSGSPFCAGKALFRLVAVLAAIFGTVVPAAHAGGPRFVTGQGWGVPPGWNIIWGTTTLLYYTDQGPLSPTVTHAQADAMVAAAAAVWNTPTSSISYAQGGQLGEDVSSANTTFDGTNVVFPADVQTSNESSIPVAIVYDVDGSLIDMLLGEGASDPDGCRQNAVVGDVDDISQVDGHFHHATLILNGNCVGSDPQALTQMQYQLARAFGRVLGLSWSQTNDNVFTAQTTVTANQMAFWPLMHPIDTICGRYSYQCMTNPFTLRVDDLNSLGQLYPVWQAAVPPGKEATTNDALWLWGIVYFPTGQGMGWLNVTTHRFHNNVDEDWQTTSSITGSYYLQAQGTPVDSTPAASSGTETQGLDGDFNFRRIPLDGYSNVYFTTEAINPLYIGDYTVGPYVRNPVAPSGSPATFVGWSATPRGDSEAVGFIYTNDASSNCNTGQDGSELAPAQLDASGWQSGLLCAWGHNSWWKVTVAAGHTWTMEVTATDETGAASVNKMQPVVGAWSADDPAGVPPTVASEAAPFNSMVLGMTRMAMGSPASDQSYRLSVSDQFGAGRPDFTYVARFLYAGSVTPATVGSSGGQIVVTGSGFQQGNEVLINGAPARVLSWTANQIVADAPSMAAAGVQAGVAVPVTVVDTSTGGSASIPAAISYTNALDVLVQVSAPTSVETGITAATPFAVRVLASDGLSPVANATVTLAVTSGSAQLGLCGNAARCTVPSDANGVVQTTITGGGAGTIILVAGELGGGTVRVALPDTDPVRSVSFSQPQRWVAAGASGSWTLQLNVVQDGVPASGVPVQWTLSPSLTAGARSSLTQTGGVANLQVNVNSVIAGSVQTVTGCVWSGVCAVWTMYGVGPSEWAVSVTGGAGQTVAHTASFNALQLAVTDLLGHPLEEAPVQVHQRVLAWEGACNLLGPCASAPVLWTSQVSLISDERGSVAVAPLEIQDLPQVLEIAISSGLQSFVTVTLRKTP